MAALIKGKICNDWLEKEISKGEFLRQDSIYRHWITADGTDHGGFCAEKDRYHLYISHACPWAHRTLIFRKLKNLENYIGVSVVSPDMLEQGWFFSKNQNTTDDSLYGFNYLHQLYTLDNPEVTTQVTVPLLWDKKTQRIVNNESSEIIRMFNGAFDHLTGNNEDFYPEHLRDEIDSINDFIYVNINNGVYRCGFATDQMVYEDAFYKLFSALDEIEIRLANQLFLVGDQLTEADWRLFTTLVRFDVVYVGHFKCNLRRIEDYHNLYNYLKHLYQMPGIADTVYFDHIKRHYYYSHTGINPTQIIPAGPQIRLSEKHDRDRFMIAD